MVVGDIKSEWKRKPVFVIAGKDDALLNVHCDELLEQLLEPHQRAMGLFNADAARVLISDVLDELRTAPFLSERRVVLIREADDFVSENRQLLERYFDNPCPTGVLVLTVKSWDSRTRLARKLSDVGELISVTQPKASEIPQRLTKYAGDAHGKNLGKDAAELLIELTGDELGRLYGEIDKLALFAADEEVITVGHIEALIGHNRLFNAFAVIDAAVGGDVVKAVNRLRDMFEKDKSAEYTVVGAFAFHFRRMFNAKVLLKKGVRPDEIANRLQVWRDREGFFGQVHRMSLKQLGANLQLLAATDYAIKTGRTKPQIAAEQLVLKLAAG